MATVVGIVASLVGPAIELGKCIVGPIKRQLTYLCCFNSHIKSLKEEAEKLEDARKELQMRVDAAERNAEVVVPQIKNWLRRASANNEIQVAKRGIEIEIPKVQSGCLTIMSRFSLSKKAKKTTDAMKELRGCNKFDRISLPAPPASTVSIPLRQTHEFESRKQIEEDIMEALRGKNINIIGICGMGGIGKTTMAKRIMNRAREELFDEVVMTVVGQQLDMLKIQRDISESLGLKLEVEALFSRAHQLRNRLKGTKRILIVVDDIWEIFKLEELGIPCESGVEGYCTILFTSRDKGVLSSMEAQKVYAIQTLSEEEAWFLFREKSGICPDDFNLLSIAQDIAEECKGLPIALVTVGSSLKGEKVERVWEGALQQLKDANPIDMPSVLQEVYNPLKLSYDSLCSQHAKSLFLLCCLFPEDSNISLKDLTLYCMGLGIFEGVRNLEQARKNVSMVVGMLKKRFLLLDGSSEYHHVRMHDVVRDVAIFIASKEGLFDVNLHSRGHNSYSECKWISFFPENGRQLVPNTMWLNFPDLHILMMHYPWWSESVVKNDSFLEGMKEVRVLSFQSISFKSIQKMQLLKNLRALHLESCILGTISFVGELSSLEILCCNSCHLTPELPIEIGRLNRLKLLEFSDCEDLEIIPPGVLSNLIELEELTIVGCFNRWELAEEKEKQSGNVNVSLNELKSLPNLMRLNIEIKDENLAAKEIHFFPKNLKCDISLGEIFHNICSYPKIPIENRMHLNLPREINLGNWIREFATTTEELCLSGVGAGKLDLSQAQNVKSLQFGNCSIVKKLVDTTSIDDWRRFGVFKVLEFLYLCNLPNLEEICDVLILNKRDGKNSHITFPQLKHLELRDLESLTTFCEEIGSIEFPMLIEMRIDNCPRFTSIVSSIENNQKSARSYLFCSQEDSFRVFPVLEDLHLLNLANLEEICNGPIPQGSNSFKKLKVITIQDLPVLKHLWKNPNQNVSLSNLRKIEMRSCNSLRSLLPVQMAMESQLEELIIFNCGMMVEVFSHEEKESHIVTFPRLKRLVLQNLKNLTILSKGIESIEFPALTGMVIDYCPKLTSLVSSSSIGSHQNSANNQDDGSIYLFCNVTFGRLKNLNISGCNNISNICCRQISDGFFTGLELLDIAGCDGIRNLFSSTIATNLVNLKYLMIERCKEMVKVIEDEDSFHVFPVLEELHLLDLPNLEEICNNPIPQGSNSFKNLKRIIFLCLPALKHLWKNPNQNVSLSIEFPALTEMEIVDCAELLSLVSSPVRNHQNSANSQDDDSANLFYNVTFGRLKRLKIGGFNNISNIWCRQISDGFFTRLGQLEIVGCDGIRSLFSSAIATNLVNLKVLIIKGCKEMVKVIEDEVEEINSEPNCPLLSPLFPRLECLRLYSLPKLGNFCEWRCDIELPMLEHLVIAGCPTMKVFTMGSLISTPKLKCIVIENQRKDGGDLNEAIRLYREEE